MIERVDAWRRKQEDLPSRAEPSGGSLNWGFRQRKLALSRRAGIGKRKLTLPLGSQIPYMRYMRLSIPHMRNYLKCELFEGTMPRPELYPVKKVIGFNREQFGAIDRWRRSQSPIPTVSDAIRQLIQSLAATKSVRRSREETSEKAAELAAQVIEKKTDKSQPVEEQKARKRKLISGPSEFRDVRRDQPKQISQQRRT